MSAIGGVIGKKTGLHLADKMLSSMCKRGFGRKESYIVSDCCMLHTNDKTNEPEKGNSIVHLELFDEKYIIVFNGKLFNKTDVCAELKRQYGCFLAMSDADVEKILVLWEISGLMTRTDCSETILSNAEL